MSALRLLTTRPERQRHESLVQQAARLWPGNSEMQLRWLRAVVRVRATRRGWILDARVPRKEPA